MGKQEVSLGESGSFVRGKSEFPLRKVKEAEKAEKCGFQGRNERYEIALHSAIMSHRNHRKHRNVLP